MALFNSNLTSSISGWFTNTFQPKSDDNNDEETKAEEQADNKETTGTSGEDAEQEEINKEKDESENLPTEDEQKPDESEPETSTMTSSVLDINAEQVQKKLTEETQKMVSSAKSFGTYLFGVASVATKKVSTTVNETASTLKKTVEEKTIFGDLNKEQKDFIEKKREKQGAGAVPPWVGYHEEETMKQQILALSTDTRNFLRSPPSGVQFQFEFEQMFPIAKATLEEDENLSKMRFRLVPMKIKEEMFWRNYFYRVSLIKQSAQLSTLTQMQKASSSDNGSSESSTSSIVIVGSTATGTLSRSSSTKSLPKSDPDSIANNTSANQKRDSESPDLTDTHDDLPNAEFVSDAFDPSMLNPDDLEREMRELGMNDEGGDEIPEWEQELQKELQDYEVVNENDKDEIWEQEIENMLTTNTST